jgi:hypothetical protein
MTRSREHGENEITEEAKREAARTERHVCDILDEMLAEAKHDGDTDRVKRIEKAQKFLGCRNRRKRRSR